MQRDHIVFSVIMGFVAGVALHSLVDFGVTFSVFVVVLGGCLFLIERHGHVLLVALALVGAGLGLLRYDISGPVQVVVPLAQTITLEGVVDREPDERDKTLNLVVAVSGVKGQPPLADTVLVYVNLPTYPKYQYGDQLTLTGKVQAPQNFDSTFDWIGYLEKEGISYQMLRPKVLVVGHGAGNPIKAALFRFKNSFLGNVNRVVPDPHAAFLGSLLIGSKASPLGADVTEQFRRAGVSHIISLSGYNLTIVADAVMRVLSLVFSQGMSLGFGALGVVLFSVMAGASATVVRAAMMSLIVIVARVSGRTYDMTRALVVAAVLMLVENPRILVFDLSFQLSFLATLGILYGPPLLTPYLTRIPGVRKKENPLETRAASRWQMVWNTIDLRGVVAVTLSAELAVLPLLLHVMGNFSAVGILVNVLILPLIPATMLAGFLTGSLGFIASLLSLPFAYLSYLLLSYEIGIVQLFAALPFAQFEIRMPLFLMFLCYIGMTYVVWRYTPLKETIVVQQKVFRE